MKIFLYTNILLGFVLNMSEIYLGTAHLSTRELENLIHIPIL